LPEYPQGVFDGRGIVICTGRAFCTHWDHIMRRFAFGFSSVALITVLTLWAVRYRCAPEIVLTHGETDTYSVACLPIGLKFEYYFAAGERPYPPYAELPQPKTGWNWKVRRNPGYMTDYPFSRVNAHVLGFRLAAGDFLDTSETTWGRYNLQCAQRVVILPYWSLILSTGMLPAICAIRAYRRHRWRRSGKCENCGYDLRASPDRCPECGVPGAPGSSTDVPGSRNAAHASQ
jgi:hypothetical protein